MCRAKKTAPTKPFFRNSCAVTVFPGARSVGRATGRTKRTAGCTRWCCALKGLQGWARSHGQRAGCMTCGPGVRRWRCSNSAVRTCPSGSSAPGVRHPACCGCNGGWDHRRRPSGCVNGRHRLWPSVPGKPSDSVPCCTCSRPIPWPLLALTKIASPTNWRFPHAAVRPQLVKKVTLHLQAKLRRISLRWSACGAIRFSRLESHSGAGGLL